MKNLKVSVNHMVKKAKERIDEITAKEAIPLLEDDDVIIVDIRDIRERQKLGFIPGSFHAPRGMLEFWVDPQSPYFKDIFSSKKRFGYRQKLGAVAKVAQRLHLLRLGHGGILQENLELLVRVRRVDHLCGGGGGGERSQLMHG